MGLPITERQASEMSGTDLFYTVVRGADGEYGDPYYVRLASLMAYLVGNELIPVVGPISATDNAVARFNVDGQHIQNSDVIIDDAGAVSGVTSLAMSAALTGATTGAFSGAVTMDDLNLYDTDASHTLTLHWNENEAGANRVLNFVMGGADRTVTLEGNSIISQDYSTDASPTFSGLAITGYVDWTEIAAPANPAADVGRMYSKDDGGVTKPYWRDSVGTESLMLGAGVTGVVAAAVIADNTLVRGDGGARGVQDSGWVLGDDDVLAAGDDLDMNDNDIVNLRDIFPFDATLNVDFASADDGTVYIKNTGAVGGFGLAAIDDHSDHLTAYWKMEETGAAARTDSVGSNDAAATGTPGTRAGINNLACDFDGADWLTVTDHADISPTTGFAISTWVYMDNLGAHRGVLEKADSFLIVQFTAPEMTFRMWESDGTQINVFASAQSIPSGSWAHVMMIADGSNVYGYVNNVQVGSALAYDGTVRDNANALTIGKDATYMWDGGIDEMGFWKNITFADEAARLAFVAGLYNAGAGRFFVAAGTGAASLDVQDYIHVSNTGLLLADTDDSHELNIKWNENEAGADRTLNMIMGGADRTLTMDADLTASDVFLKSFMAAKGDLISATADDTPVIVPIGGTDGWALIVDVASAAGMKWAAVAGIGDVVGPAGATDHAAARFDTATGKLLQDSVVIITDGGAVTGVLTLGASGAITMDDLYLYDTNASHTLLFHWNEDEAGANRTLNWVVGGADRTITLSGDVTLNDWFDQSVKQAASPTLAGLTISDGGNITLQEVLDFAGATGENQIRFNDNLADALSVVNDNGDVFQKFISTTGALAVEFPQPVIFSAVAGTPMANALYADNVVNGYVHFDTDTIQDSFNVASLTDTAVGKHVVVWDVDFANVNYAGFVSAAYEGMHNFTRGYATTGLTVYTMNIAHGYADSGDVCVIAIGDQ